MLRGPDNLYDDAASGIKIVDSFLPASKGEVRDVNIRLRTELKTEHQDSSMSNVALKAKFEEYKNETTTVINGLVGKINSLSLVGNTITSSSACLQGLMMRRISLGWRMLTLCRGTMEPMAWTALMGQLVRKYLSYVQA